MTRVVQGARGLRVGRRAPRERDSSPVAVDRRAVLLSLLSRRSAGTVTELKTKEEFLAAKQSIGAVSGRPRDPGGSGTSRESGLSRALWRGRAATSARTYADGSPLSALAVPSGAAIFDYSAVWCGPCKMIAPVYEALAKETPGVSFFKVDIDNPEMTEAVTDADISSVPTFVAYKNGSFVSQFSGADRQKLKALVDALAQ